MITFTQGNLLEARTEVLVNAVNTVGVMGKGIALMFKERFPENFRHYARACKAGEVRTGTMFITQVNELTGPRWIVNFPTKQHWRAPSQMIWITEGLQGLRRFLIEEQIKSVAIPPLGAGQGGLPWPTVRHHIEQALGDLDLDIQVFEPTAQYQNTARRQGTEQLTPARALITELVRRYCSLGMECSQLEIQKITWFLERTLLLLNPEDNPLKLDFQAHRFGPYTSRLIHLLDKLDGSYLHSEKRISDANREDTIWFEHTRRDILQAYLTTETRTYLPALETTAAIIDGFESPFGMELLATVDWLLYKEHVAPNVPALREGLCKWPGGLPKDAARKARIFDDRVLGIALEHLQQSPLYS